MLTASEQGHTHETVDVLQLIRNQREAIAEVLEGLKQKLDQDDLERRRAFRDERLSALFPPSLGYTLQKLREATLADDTFGSTSLGHVRSVIEDFSAALDRRGIGVAGYPGVETWFQEIQHPLQELDQFFDPATQGSLHPRTAEIVAEQISKKMDELARMAREIDEDWKIEEP